jgi:hypothetical protein
MATDKLMAKFCGSLKIVIVTAYFSLFFGCNCMTDCVVDSIYFNVVDASGKSVFAEPDPLFDYSAVRVIYTHNGNVREEQPSSYNDIEVGFNIRLNVEKYIIKYSETESDTIHIQPTYRETECCGSLIENFDLYVNKALLCNDCVDRILTIVR